MWLTHLLFHKRRDRQERLRSGSAKPYTWRNVRVILPLLSTDTKVVSRNRFIQRTLRFYPDDRAHLLSSSTPSYRLPAHHKRKPNLKSQSRPKVRADLTVSIGSLFTTTTKTPQRLAYWRKKIPSGLWIRGDPKLASSQQGIALHHLRPSHPLNDLYSAAPVFRP